MDIYKNFKDWCTDQANKVLKEIDKNINQNWAILKQGNPCISTDAVIEDINNYEAKKAEIVAYYKMVVVIGNYLYFEEFLNALNYKGDKI